MTSTMQLLNQAIHWNNEGAMLLASHQTEAAQDRLEQSLLAMKTLLSKSRVEPSSDSANPAASPSQPEPVASGNAPSVQFYWTHRMQASMMQKKNGSNTGHSSDYSAATSFTDSKDESNDDGQVFMIDQPLQFELSSDAEMKEVDSSSPCPNNNSKLTLYAAGVIFNLALAYHSTNPTKSKSLYMLLMRCFPNLDTSSPEVQCESTLALGIVALNNLATLACGDDGEPTPAGTIQQYWQLMASWMFRLQQQQYYQSLESNLLEESLGQRLYEELLLNIFLCPASKHSMAGAA